MDIYEKLGVKKLINAAGTYTVVGGSKMSQETLDAMCEAAQSYVFIRDLQTIIHNKLAEITNNEAAFITPGAAAGLYAAIGACVSSRLGKPLKHCSMEEIGQFEVLVFAAHMNPYFEAVAQLGVKLTLIGYANEIYPISGEDIKNRISNNTIAFLYAHVPANGWKPVGDLPFDIVRDLLQDMRIALIVDGAAQLPPRENLWWFTENGADAIVFSGGKGLCGPQATGLILGKTWLLERVCENGFPNYGFGRMLKVGREEMVAIYSAVEQYLRSSDDSEVARCEHIVERVINAFAGEDTIEVRRGFPNEAGQPVPRAIVTINGLSSEDVAAALLDGEPGIYVNGTDDNKSFFINPITVNEDEVDTIISNVKKVATEHDLRGAK